MRGTGEYLQQTSHIVLMLKWSDSHIVSLVINPIYEGASLQQSWRQEFDQGNILTGA